MFSIEYIALLFFRGHYHLGTRYVLLICLSEIIVPSFRLVGGSRSTSQGARWSGPFNRTISPNGPKD